MKTIVLTGMSGSGKSSVGKVLAEKYHLKFIDIDEQIVLNEKKSINEIFSENGENYFRALEVQTIKNIFEPENLVISLGGGAFENDRTRNFLLNNSTVIYLQTSPETISPTRSRYLLYKASCSSSRILLASVWRSVSIALRPKLAKSIFSLTSSPTS